MRHSVADARKPFRRWKTLGSPSGGSDIRIRILYAGAVFFALCIMAKLVFVQLIDHAFYEALASGQHQLFQELIPERGDIFVHDTKDGTLVAVATNELKAFLYADPRQVKDSQMIAKTLGQILEWDEEKTMELAGRLSNEKDPYEPIAREVNENRLQQVIAAGLEGIGYVREPARIYPESGLGGHVFGFVGFDHEGYRSGKYGIEGYFDKDLTGIPGFLRSERDLAGRLIAIGERSYEPAVDGADIILTLDRTVQFTVCSKLVETVRKHDADGGSIVILEPSTGRILAMCGVPDFDSNQYNKVPDITAYNNPAIFDSYEPGSIFKSMTMAAAIDTGSVNPMTLFEDTGSVLVDGWPKPIANAENKKYGVVTMTDVLDNSINTGVIFAMRQMGMDPFVSAVKDFGFGKKTGVEMETEAAGNISSLDIGEEIYAATASFGQGITVTPLQMAAAYAAIANGGVLLEPHIVDEIRYTDGRVDKKAVKEVRRVIQEKTARLVGAMLVSVVENGHGKRAGVPGYYIGGKTGTAQVPKKDGGGYDSDITIGSFAGFGPINDPRFVMVVRIDNPKDIRWAESTAAPLFGEIADFLLRYYEIP